MEQLLSPYLTALFWVGLLIPIGIVLRSKIPFFQKYLVPSSLITGFIGMILMNLQIVGVPTADGWAPIDFKTYAMLTSLIFIANFMMIGLASGKSNGEGGKTKEMTRGVVWLSITFYGGYGVLILTGLAVIWGYNYLTGAGLENATAVNMVHGFTGGPAQALTIAQMWVNNAANADINHLWIVSSDVLVMAVSYGAAGFLIAAFVGVPLANYGLRKGLSADATSIKLDDAFLRGIMPGDAKESLGRHTMHPASLDTITFHLAMLCIAFFFTWCFCYALKMVLPKDIAVLGFGLMFMWGLFCGLVLRKIINVIKKDYLIDDDLVHRINGTLVDFMMITALMAVKWAVLGKYIVPFTVTVVLASFLLFLWFWIPSRWLGRNGLERFLVNYAACTGTLASSLLLMRIVDPKGESLVPAEAGFSQFMLILPVAPMALFIFPAIGVKTSMTTVLYTGVVVLAVSTILMLWLKATGYWKGGQEKDAEGCELSASAQQGQ
ncbi:sodium/glutamate symporter family protein [Desulforhopalus singaporensis]|uniref:Na+/glutamate symporter n=1 Tax=Desulforhopalus singaporensis TaxID=91360 RepID=A0A1H0SCC1_9BACT|nr:hypothetical protein [Desulforhopalus singaporensis]SDP39452.1 Na+/glutamate symporter [Desulforhopalus singaporensis]